VTVPKEWSFSKVFFVIFYLGAVAEWIFGA